MPLTLQQPPNLVLLPLLQLLVEYVYGIEAHPGFAYPELIVESLLDTARVLHGIYLCMCEAHPDIDDYTHQLEHMQSLAANNASACNIQIRVVMYTGAWSVQGQVAAVAESAHVISVHC